MNLNVVGPLLFATMLFGVSGTIKVMGYDDFEVFWELAPVGPWFVLHRNFSDSFRSCLLVNSHRNGGVSGFLTPLLRKRRIPLLRS
jgi:hypothetical protein